jgi:hypothetical protein
MWLVVISPLLALRRAPALALQARFDQLAHGEELPGQGPRFSRRAGISSQLEDQPEVAHAPQLRHSEPRLDQPLQDPQAAGGGRENRGRR